MKHLNHSTSLCLHSLLAWPLLLGLALAPVGVSAEDPTRGRLPDGRAFRTDVQGNQLVDYIADLEMNVETLQRQLSGAQSEIEQKDRSIELMKRSGGAVSAVAERDLMAPSAGRESVISERSLADARAAKEECSEEIARTQIALKNAIQTLEDERALHEHSLGEYQQVLTQARAVAQQAKAAPVECAPTSCAAQVASALNSELQPVRNELERTTQLWNEEREQRNREQNQYQASLQQVRRAVDAKQCPALDCSTVVNSVRQELERANTEVVRVNELLSSARTAWSAEKMQFEDRITNSHAEVVALKGEIAAQQDRYGVLNAKYEQILTRRPAADVLARSGVISGDIADEPLGAEAGKLAVSSTSTRASFKSEPKSESASASVPASSDQGAIGKIDSQKIKTDNTPSDSGTREGAPTLPSSLSVVRNRAVESLRGGMQSDLNRLRDLISQRDRFYEQYGKMPARVVQLRPTLATSSRGRTPQQLVEALRASTSVYEVSIIKREIYEIRAKMQDDIATAQRMINSTSR